MTDRELYRQKMQAQLDEWEAMVGVLKARMSKASAELQLGINQQVRALESGIAGCRTKLSGLASAGEDAWESTREGVESAWGSLKSAVSDATGKLTE